MTTRMITRKTATGKVHPMARPMARCRPERVSGIPILLESRALAADIPKARFHEKENPNFLPMGSLSSSNSSLNRDPHDDIKTIQAATLPRQEVGKEVIVRDLPPGELVGDRLISRRIEHEEVPAPRF